LASARRARNAPTTASDEKHTDDDQYATDPANPTATDWELAVTTRRVSNSP